MRRAGPRLVGVHDELVAVLSGEDFVRRPHDRVGELGIEALGLPVRQRGGLLDVDNGVDERSQGRELGDGKVVAGALGLDAVQRVGRHRQLAQRITLDTGRAHRLGLESGIAHDDE